MDTEKFRTFGLNPSKGTLAMGTLCRERKLRVAKKRVIARYPKAFRKMAVERLKRSDNIVALSHELGCTADCSTNGEISWSPSKMTKDHGKLARA